MAKQRKYSKPELERSPYLLLYYSDRPIGTHSEGTIQQVDEETYVAEADRLQKNGVRFGTLTPYHGLCVDESLARDLECANLNGLILEPVVVLPEGKRQKVLRKISSQKVASPSLLPVVDDRGNQIEPNTNWPCWFDDGGYQPVEIRYSEAELKHFSGVDIAVTHERTGVTKARSFRWCVVSQRFRRVMEDLSVVGVRYAPVKFGAGKG